MNNTELHLICLMKIVDDVDDISVNDYRQAGEQGLDMSYVRKMINCFDEAALENALNIKDQRCEAGQDTRISVITLNPGYASHFLDPLFAIKVDEVRVVQTARNLWHDPIATAEVLAKEIEEISEKGSRKLIFTGKQAPPLNSSLVPAMIAEHLGMIQIREVSDIWVESEHVILEQKDAEHIALYRIDQDAVLSFANTKHSYLRVPTLREKLKYKNVKPDEVIYPFEENEQEPKLSCNIREIDCEWIHGETKQDVAEMILAILNDKEEM